MEQSPQSHFQKQNKIVRIFITSKIKENTQNLIFFFVK